MVRRTILYVALATLLGMTSYANAQGRAPGGAQSGPRAPSIGRALNSQRFGSQSAETTRHVEARRAQAEARRQDAQRRRAEAAENNRSAEARAAHPPNERAADEASRAEENADNKDRLELRRTLRANRGDHGR